MKCAKCGYDIDPAARSCPHCAAGEHRSDSYANPGRGLCPVCGSNRVFAVRKNFNPGCGCLGVLLFGWIGLLLGLLGAGEVEMVCADCGAKWPAGRPRQAGQGCCWILVLLLVIAACGLI